jgi:hypothetical protein
MSESDIQIILLRLEQLENHLQQIHSEVKKTNGRVTSLELEEARQEGSEEARRMPIMVFTSVLSGGILAMLIWFVTQAI